jgi:hypothetical protein
MDKNLRRRRNAALGVLLIGCLGALVYLSGQVLPTVNPEINPVEAIEYSDENEEVVSYSGEVVSENPLAINELEKLSIHEHASKTGYARDQFLSSGAWNKWQDCNTREKILGRDLDEIIYDANGCTVLAGILHDPYTGKTIDFQRGTSTSSAVQIDHIIALSNAWKTGAQDWTFAKRNQFANDDLNLIAADGPANMQKSDHDASEWLPSNKSFRCEYVARQIAVKLKYMLWAVRAEYDTMKNILSGCPDQEMPTP